MVHSAPKMTVNVYPVMPPAHEIGKRCLAQLLHGGDKKEAPGLDRFLGAWVDMHHPIWHEESPPIAPLTFQSSMDAGHASEREPAYVPRRSETQQSVGVCLG